MPVLKYLKSSPIPGIIENSKRVEEFILQQKS